MEARGPRLDEVRGLGATRQRFDTQRAGAGEKIEDARALHVILEEIEQRGAHVLRGGPNPEIVRRDEIAARELATDDPQWLRNGGRGIRTPKSLRTPVFKTGALAILPALLQPKLKSPARRRAQRAAENVPAAASALCGGRRERLTAWSSSSFQEQPATCDLAPNLPTAPG